MIALKNEKLTAEPSGTPLRKQIEEAAYYCYLNRQRYAQEGDNLRDWHEAEKEVRGKQTINIPRIPHFLKFS